MASRNFMELLRAKWDESKFVCIGLDSEAEKVPGEFSGATPESSVVNFNKAIIEATGDLVCAYKLNSAFYEALGLNGMRALAQSIDIVHRTAPTVLVILDYKRGDIGNTNRGYVKLAYEVLKADAVTVHPYLGKEALPPFLEREDKGIFVLCRTSNPGAGEFQDLQVLVPPLSNRGGKVFLPSKSLAEYEVAGFRTMPLYQVIAAHVADNWNAHNNCALVMGATYPEELAEVRSIVDDMPILIPGVGAQGGDVKATINAGKDKDGYGMIINSSRGIIFAKQNNQDTYADVNQAMAARLEAIKLQGQIVDGLATA